MMPRLWKYCVPLAGFAALQVAAQELSVLGGGMNTSTLEQTSYTWQLDYRHAINPHLAASFAYINEGHVAGHHRDGSAFEAWAQWPLDHDRLTLSAGLGAYLFYDTQALPNGDAANFHGTAPIFSLSATGALSDRWFYRAVFNHIHPSNDILANTLAVGLGMWLGDGPRPTRGKQVTPPNGHDFVTPNELTIFGGQSVVNNFFSPTALAWGAEYRRGISSHFDLTASYIYEGDPEIVRRQGVAVQAWAVNTFLDRRFSVGFGLGPYFYIDHKHPENRLGVGMLVGRGGPEAAAPLASLTFKVRLSDFWHTRVVWNRVTTIYNRDADVFLVGLGCQWR